MSKEQEELEGMRFPVGPFEWNGAWSADIRDAWTDGIRRQPAELRLAIGGLTAEQLDTPYRPGGWTVRQVVHHMADSHMQSVTRFKLALTETNPVIKPYREELWAELGDSASYPVEASLALLDALHLRWTALLESMSEEDYLRSFFHPESGSLVPLRRALGLYDWHGRHHIAHIMGLRKRMGW